MILSLHIVIYTSYSGNTNFLYRLATKELTVKKARNDKLPSKNNAECFTFKWAY